MRSLPRLNATSMTRRGEIWLARLGPQPGTKPGKNRPVLIVQAQALISSGHPSTIVIPLTTNLVDDAAPLRVRVPARERLHRDSDLLIDQVRALDNRRLLDGPLTTLDDSLMSQACRALSEVLDLTA